MTFKEKDKGQQRRQKAYNYLLAQGLEPHLAAGVVGNLMRESYKHLDPTAVNDSSGAFGIAQWLGGRKDRLMEFAKERKKPATDFELQLEYLAFEINNPDKFSWTPRQRDAFFNAKTVEEAAWLFQDKFERAGEDINDPAVQERMKNARAVYLYHNDEAIYAKDNKGQVVNVNPEAATPEQVAKSPAIRDEFYQQQYGITSTKDQTQTNDPPEALKQAREAAETEKAKKQREEEFMKKMKQALQQEEQKAQEAPQQEQQALPNPEDLTPTQNEFFGSFIP